MSEECGTTQNVYRVQHKEDGRGPWRPGFTKLWSTGKPLPPPWFEEFSEVTLEQGWYYGSGVLTVDSLLLWFTPDELYKLVNTFDYEIACLISCEIIGRSNSQVLFRRRSPHRLQLANGNAPYLQVLQ